MVDDQENWMNKNNATNREIAHWVSKYILFRGTRKFENMGMMSAHMKEIAQSQDKIGWRNFMEGRISKKFYLLQLQLQRHHLALMPNQSTAEAWMKQETIHHATHIHITHSQWVFFAISPCTIIREGYYVEIKQRKF